MKHEDLLEAIGEVRDEWIEDAHGTIVRRYRLPLLAAALIMALLLSLSAFAAADMDGFYELLSSVSPGLAQSLKPVQMSCTSNGIEMKVISADVEGDTAKVFVGLRDLEGDRIDETCDLYDSYSIDLPSRSIIGHCSFSSFDPETKTALFVVEVSRGDGRRITGSKLTFSLRQFLSGKHECNQILPLNQALIQRDPPTTEAFAPRGFSISDAEYAVTKVMVPGDSLLEPAKGVKVTAMGWVDNMLRIQVHYERILETDNHGFITLVDEAGNEVLPHYSISFWDEEYSGSYEDYLFRISPEELKVYQIKGEFIAADQLYNGEWEITFPL